jgi:hypothetical protein
VRVSDTHLNSGLCPLPEAIPQETPGGSPPPEDTIVTDEEQYDAGSGVLIPFSGADLPMG